MAGYLGTLTWCLQLNQGGICQFGLSSFEVESVFYLLLSGQTTLKRKIVGLGRACCNSHPKPELLVFRQTESPMFLHFSGQTLGARLQNVLKFHEYFNICSEQGSVTEMCYLHFSFTVWFLWTQTTL